MGENDIHLRCLTNCSLSTNSPTHSPNLVFFNKAGHKVSPYMSAAWRPKAPRTLLARLRALMVVSYDAGDIGGRRIDVAPWPEHIDEDGVVHFRDNGRPEYLAMKDQKIKPDVVVFCTGYKQTLPFLRHRQQQHGSTAADDAEDYNYSYKESSNPTSSSSLSFLDVISGGTANGLVRNIWPPSDPTLAFIGFVRPNLGAIPPLAELQAMLWVSRLLIPSLPSPSSALLPKELHPSDEPHYRLTSREGARIRYGVDHESYAYQLALDMGAAPGLGDVLRIANSGGGELGDPDSDYKGGKPQQIFWRRLCRVIRDFEWRLPLTWALGANFNTKFRLCGPWKWDGAREDMLGELWETVARREVFFGEFCFSLFCFVGALLCSSDCG